MKLSIVNLILSIVLLSSLFYVGVTSSIAVYDPYADYDQDGDIDIYDVVPMADAYGTTGDSTRNVTIVNWVYPSKNAILVENLNITWIPVEDYLWVYTDPVELGLVDVTGFNRMTVYMRISNFTHLGGGGANKAGAICRWYSNYEFGEKGSSSLSVEWDDFAPLTVFDTQELNILNSPFLRFTVTGKSQTQDLQVSRITCLVSIGIYLRNE